MAADPTTLPGAPLLDRSWLVALIGPLLATPLAFFGYGTDLDIPNVLRAGRSWLDDGSYELSRGPGAPFHELATAALDRVGGSVLVNLVGLAFGALALRAVHRLLLLTGSRHAGPATLVLAANPWYWVAASALGDFVWALALSLTGVVAARRDRRWLAGLLFGLAIACRMSTVLVVGAWLVAERTGSGDRPAWAASWRTASTAGAVGAAGFVPSWLWAERTLKFLDNEFEFEGIGVHLGRWGVKNLAVFGVLGTVVLLARSPVLLRACRTWRTSVVVRFALLAFVLEELLFLRLPFKPVHLLPAVAAVALLVGAAAGESGRRLAWGLVTTSLLLAVVSITVSGPDRPNAAETGEARVRLVDGVLLNDASCRWDDRRNGEWPDPLTVRGAEEAEVRAEALFDCQAESWRADP